MDVCGAGRLMASATSFCHHGHADGVPVSTLQAGAAAIALLFGVRLAHHRRCSARDRAPSVSKMNKAAAMCVAIL